jgi:hypothetical protein
MQMMSEEPTAEECLLIRPLSYVLEFCGLAQARAARREKLQPIDVMLLRRAAWNGMVSFDCIYRETGLARYVISRAAAKLESRSFGKVKRVAENKRWKYLQITLLGFKCCQRIDKEVVSYLMNTQWEPKVTSYYTFASYICNAANWLPGSSKVLGRWGFPEPIIRGSDLNAQQKKLISFLEALQRDSEFLESRRRASQKLGSKKSRRARSGSKHNELLQIS